MAYQSNIGLRPAVVSSVFAGVLLTGVTAFAEEATGAAQNSSQMTLSFGSKLVEFEGVPLSRPLKRPDYLELAGEGLDRPSRRPAVEADTAVASHTPANSSGSSQAGGLPAFVAWAVGADSEASRQAASDLGNETARTGLPLSVEVASADAAEGGQQSQFGRVQSGAAGFNSGDGLLADEERWASLPIRNAASYVDLLSVTANTLQRPKRRPVSVEELECLAHAIYFEARGESDAGRRAVAMTVMNRVRSNRFPDTICKVVKQGEGAIHRCQFSYYCDGRPELIHEAAVYKEIKDLARKVVERHILADPTGGATYFHATRILPNWAKQMKKTTRIGRHVFYRDT